MQQHLQKFLVLYRKLSIPQLGSFTIDNEPARFDIPSGLLFAPKPVIHFAQTAEPMNERVFFDFLSEQMGVDEMTAITEFQNFSHKFRNDIQQHSLGLLPGVGRITRGSEGNLFFTQETNLLELLPPIQLDEKMRIQGVDKKPVKEGRKEMITEPAREEIIEEAEETLTSHTDRWWVYAIVLLVTGILALLFYYQ